MRRHIALCFSSILVWYSLSPRIVQHLSGCMREGTLFSNQFTVTMWVPCSTVPSQYCRFHFVRSRNLPYSFENVKQICRNCSIYQEEKPPYYRPNSINLIKVMHPFERISVDFKCPIPFTKHLYLLTIVDEYSRCPFGYPVSDTSAQT